MSLWLDPCFGAAGDMLLGALIGLADEPGQRALEIADHLARLDLDGWTLEVETTERASVSATRAVVGTGSSQHHRSWSSIDQLLARADLPAPVIDGARRSFRRLGEVEAGIHQVSIDDVHFHEVGALDAIIDIVGSWLALLALGSGDVAVVSGPVGLGSGSVEAAHGTLPLPAPATAELLIGVPVRSVAVEAETVTPTGAVLLATMVQRWGPIPNGTLVSVSRGAGGRNPQSHPNVVTAMLLAHQGEDQANSDTSSQDAVELTTNLDDVTPELVAYVLDLALSAGAADAWSTPITMKKGRAAVALTVLCDPQRAAELEALLFAETGSLGLRIRPATKRVLTRRIEVVEVEGHQIRVKVGPSRAKPEFDDVAAAARALKRPFRDVAAAARNAAATVH